MLGSEHDTLQARPTVSSVGWIKADWVIFAIGDTDIYTPDSIIVNDIDTGICLIYNHAVSYLNDYKCHKYMKS